MSHRNLKWTWYERRSALCSDHFTLWVWKPSETFSCHSMCFELAVLDYCQIITALKDSVSCLSPFRVLFLEYAYAIMNKIFHIYNFRNKTWRKFFICIFSSAVVCQWPMLICLRYLQCSLLSMQGCCSDQDAVKWDTLQFYKDLRYEVT